MVVSIAVIRGLAAQLKRAGVEVEHFCAEAGLGTTDLTDPTGRVSLDEFSRAIEAAIRLSGDPALGLRVAEATPASYLALVGNLLVNCPTMRDAIGIYGRFSMLVTRAVTWDLVEGERTSSYVYNQPYVGGDAARFSAELSMALTIAFAHHFVGHGHTPIEARFRHAAPRHLAAYERVFQCPLVFRAERNELVFDSKLLDEVPMQHDELVWNALNQRAEHLLAEDNGAWGLPERVKSALHHESDLGDVDTGGVARRLGLTSRGLRRRLSEEGRPLSTLIAEVRCELACARLRDPDSCIKDLADNLGFSEPSAFHRAFKRWTGQTPAQYRSGGSGGSASRASGAAPQLSLVG